MVGPYDLLVFGVKSFFLLCAFHHHLSFCSTCYDLYWESPPPTATPPWISLQHIRYDIFIIFPCRCSLCISWQSRYVLDQKTKFRQFTDMILCFQSSKRITCNLSWILGQLTVLSPATVPYCRRMFPLMQMLQPFSATPSMVNFGCHAATKPLVMNNFDANSAIKQGLLFSWLDLDPCVIDGDYFNVPDNLMSEWLNISVYFV